MSQETPNGARSVDRLQARSDDSDAQEHQDQRLPESVCSEYEGVVAIREPFFFRNMACARNFGDENHLGTLKYPDVALETRTVPLRYTILGIVNSGQGGRK